MTKEQIIKGLSQRLQKMYLETWDSNTLAEVVYDFVASPRNKWDLEFYSAYPIGEWVDICLFDAGIIKKCCITAVKFSQGGHVHYDLLVLTHTDDNGKENYQKLYNIPQGLLNKIL